MKQETDALMSRNSALIRIAFAVGAVLLIPLVAMQFTSEVNWDLADFIIMGVVLFGLASLFSLAVRRAPQKHRLLIGIAFVAVFVYVWAELAVGVFTKLGS